MLVSSHQLIPVIHTHTSANDLANAGHENVNTLSDTTILRVLLHVEGLDLSGEVSEEDGGVDDISHPALRGLGDIVTELVGLALLVGDVVLDKPVDGIGVLHATEGTAGRLEVWVKGIDVPGDFRLGEGIVDDLTDHLLQMVQEVGELDEVELGFDVSVLGQVAAGQGLLSAERGANTVHIAQGRKTGLKVQLRGLCEIGRLAIVVELEQATRSFNWMEGNTSG
jgi:hypothetical protein